jgi:uncharacterized DUF497 family protein
MVTYDEAKRILNLDNNGIDLADVEEVFDHPAYTTTRMSFLVNTR